MLKPTVNPELKANLSPDGAEGCKHGPVFEFVAVLKAVGGDAVTNVGCVMSIGTSERAVHPIEVSGGGSIAGHPEYKSMIL